MAREKLRVGSQGAKIKHCLRGFTRRRVGNRHAEEFADAKG